MFNRTKKMLLAVAAFAALALGGSAIAGAANSKSTTTSPTQSGTTAQTQKSKPPAPPSMPAHGTAAHEDAEKPVTGDAATKAKAAAVKSIGSGTAGEVTTDFTGNGYEVTVTKSDGSKVEVHLDKSFNVVQGPGGQGVQGPGGPAGHGPFGG